MDKQVIPFTTDASGAVTFYSRPFSGEIEAFYFDVDTLDATADITITDDESGAPILTITNLAADGWYPVRVDTVDEAGAARLYAAAGEAVGDRVPVDGQIKFVVAQGGNVQAATVTVYVRKC